MKMASFVKVTSDALYAGISILVQLLTKGSYFSTFILIFLSIFVFDFYSFLGFLFYSFVKLFKNK